MCCISSCMEPVGSWPACSSAGTMALVCKPNCKSVVWMYFGLKADGNGLPVRSDEAVCRLCRRVVLAKGGNTTNLRSHLARRHRAEFLDTFPPGTATASPRAQGVDINHDELTEDAAILQNHSNSSYVPDAVIPPGEPWLHGGPCRAVLSLPSCLCVYQDGGPGMSSPGFPGEGRGEMKVYAKCQLQQGVMFGPYVGEVCKGQMPNNLKYAWAVRDDSGFSYVDAVDENKSNWMRYVTYTSSEEEHNLVVFQFYRHIYYRVSQPISEGTELKVWIGRDYASLLGLGMGDNVKCEIGDKEAALRLLQDIQLVTLPELSSTSLWSDSSQSQSPMPVISDVTTVSNPEAAGDPGMMSTSSFSSTSQNSLISQCSFLTEKYDFLPGTEKLLSNPNAPLNSPWHFFGLEPDPTGRPLDRSTAVCKLCMEHVSCGGSLDLQNHLTSKHHIKLRDMVKDRSLAAAVPLRPLPAVGQTVSSQVVNAIVNFLITDLQPASVVEGSGFRQLLHTLLPAHRELPKPWLLEGVMRDQHIRGRVSLAQLLRQKTGGAERDEVSDHTAPLECEPWKCQRPSTNQREAPPFVTLSGELWLHSWQGNPERYLTLWAHCIDENFSFHNQALATRKLTSSGENYFEALEAQVKAMTEEWGGFRPNFIVLGVEGTSRMGMDPATSEKSAEATGSCAHPNSTTFLEREDSASPEEVRASEPGEFGEGFPLVPCFFSSVQAGIEELMAHPVIRKTLSQFQDHLSELFLPPTQSKGSLLVHAHKLLKSLPKEEQAQLTSWAHCRPAWKDLYPLLSTLVKHKSLISDVLKEVKGERSAAESALGGCPPSSTAAPQALRSEWKVLEDLCLVLKPLDVACQTLAKEAFPRLSLIKPILTGLLSRHFVARPGDSSSILKEVKRLMRRKLTSCYSSPAVNRVLCVACSLDPQFRELGFMEEKEQAATFNWLKNEAVRITKENSLKKPSKTEERLKRSVSPESPESENDLRRSKRLKECPPINFKEMGGEESDPGEAEESEEPDPAFQPGLSGMEFLLGDLFCSASKNRESSAEESVDMEISVFRADKGASLGMEPLQWWRTKAVQFPLLASVARAYLAAPAVAGNAAQEFIQDGTTNRRRSNIPPESLDTMLFLHHNHISVTDGGPAAASDRG
ncbi:uncharacterized protein LOC101160625 isoform X1 [Oryzias latipes]|uniref:SET domain-containing protein n=1 Tax=Oryzias latipes TaxID=8090 RepID=A0A3B3I3V0_ORYLA|nr:uncharacterized protein LOC101160625 isoform X1 [Oryzias latipes]